MLGRAEAEGADRPPVEKVGVYVLGMHRSGTSLVTRLVNLLGVPVSVASDWYPSSPDNPTGFWESSALMEVNERLLALLGGSSVYPPDLQDGWQHSPTLDGIRSEGLAAFASVYPSEQWVWKDPRTCITFPFWRELVSARPVLLLVHRNPLAVARSLAVRVGMTYEHAVSLWERYTVAALRAAAGLPVYMLAYDEVLDEPLHWCASVSDYLAAQSLVLRSNWHSEVEAFVDNTLRHGSGTADVRAHRWGREVAPIYEWLLSSTGPHPCFEPPDRLAESAQTRDFFAHPRSARRRLRSLRARTDQRLRHFASRADALPTGRWRH